VHPTLGSAHPCGCTYPFGYAKGVKRCPKRWGVRGGGAESIEKRY
jgi:hypothetical protein